MALKSDDGRLKRVDVIGVPISAVNMAECVELLTGEIDALRGEYVCVSNVHTTVMAHDNPEYMRVQSSSVLSVPDGKPLSIIGKKQASEMDRVTGPDLMRELLSSEKARGKRHYFYGNNEENLVKLIKEVKNEYPDAVIAGYEPSVFRPLTAEEELELANRLNTSEADYAWIAIGAPRQEELCFRLKGKTDCVMIGVGGAFNILAGITPEAPQWVQNLSLEWLYRLIQEPRRLFKRYAVTNTRFILYAIAKIPPKK